MILTRREAADRLKWLLNFIDLKISSLNHGEFIKHFYDFLYNFYSDPEFGEREIRELCIDELGNREGMKGAQKKIRTLLGMLLFGSDVYRMGGFSQQMPSHVVFKPNYVVYHDNSQIEVRVISNILINPSLVYSKTGETKEITSWEDLRLYNGKDVGLSFSSPVSAPPDINLFWAVVFVNFLDPNMQTSALAFLLPIFQQIGVDRIFRCLECDRLEFTNKKKEQSLCSRCLTKARVKKWRKKSKKSTNS